MVVNGPVFPAVILRARRDPIRALRPLPPNRCTGIHTSSKVSSSIHAHAITTSYRKSHTVLSSIDDLFSTRQMLVVGLLDQFTPWKARMELRLLQRRKKDKGKAQLSVNRNKLVVSLLFLSMETTHGMGCCSFLTVTVIAEKPPTLPGC
jgi:hypothetical protein